MNRRSKYWYLWIGIIILSLINISINILRTKEDKVSFHSEDKIKRAEEMVETLDVIKPEGERHISNLKLAYEGRMDYTEEIIGEAAEQYIISHPTIISYFLGGLLVKEEEVFILTNGYFGTDGKVVAGDVVRIAREENNYSNFENPVNINVNYDTNDAVIT